MTFKSLILLTILAVFVASPLLADCWLDCDEAEQEALEACALISDPAENLECIRWATIDHITCLDACESGDDYWLAPGPWWVSQLDENRCSLGRGQMIPTSASFSGRSIDSLRLLMSVKGAGGHSESRTLAKTQQFPDPVYELAKTLIRSLRSESGNKQPQELADRPRGGFTSAVKRSR